MLQLLEKYIYDLELSLAYRLRSFRDRYCSDGDISYLYFAAHAAFPNVITPDLLYKIWLNFRKDQSKEPKDLQIPFIAVSDLLLSPLFRVTGRNTFEMPGGIRTLLLRLLQEDERFGEVRMDDLALFLKAYLQENAHAIPYEAFRQALEYIVMARFQPEAAAEKLINAFNEAKSAGEVQHLLNLAEGEIKAQKFKTSGTKHPLVVATQLVRGIQEYRNGNIENGLNFLKNIASNLSNRAYGGISISVEQNILDTLPQYIDFTDDRPLFFGTFLTYEIDNIPVIGIKKEKDKILKVLKPVIGVNSIVYKNCKWEFLKSKALENKDRIFIFHFAGQCIKGDLIFKDQSVNAYQLAELLQMLPNLKLVFLNTVASVKFIDTLSKAGVKCIISSEYEVSEYEAQEFAENFYYNLVKFQQVKKAFKNAENGWQFWRKNRHYARLSKNDNLPYRSSESPWNLNIKDSIRELRISELKNQVKPRKAQPINILSWEAIVKAYENETFIKGKVLSRIKGGLKVDCNGWEAFLPGSQIELKPVSNYAPYIGQEMELKVVKLNFKIKNAVVSRKEVIEFEAQEKRKEILDNLNIGQIKEGFVKSITDFGAFLDLGGVDGLLYITDISWGRISHPSEVLSLNQKINVVVLDFEENKKRISLGLKQLQLHPWDVLDNTTSENSIVKGKIVNIEDYGAFLEIQPGVEGLIHVSEVSWLYQPINAREFFKLGQEYSAKVVTIDRDKRIMALSLKQMVTDPWSEIENRYPLNSHHTGEVKNLTPYGVFIELAKGIGGMVHISDLSWTKRYDHPSEFTKVGEKIEVIILDIDKENRNLSLGHKQLEENPWDTIEKEFQVDTYIEAAVSYRDDRGATVTLSNRFEAFAPIEHIHKWDGSLVEIGDVLTVKILEINRDEKRFIVSHSRYLEDVQKGSHPSIKLTVANAEINSFRVLLKKQFKKASHKKKAKLVAAWVDKVKIADFAQYLPNARPIEIGDLVVLELKIVVSDLAIIIPDTSDFMLQYARIQGLTQEVSDLIQSDRLDRYFSQSINLLTNELMQLSLKIVAHYNEKA